MWILWRFILQVRSVCQSFRPLLVSYFAVIVVVVLNGIKDYLKELITILHPDFTGFVFDEFFEM